MTSEKLISEKNLLDVGNDSEKSLEVDTDAQQFQIPLPLDSVSMLQRQLEAMYRQVQLQQQMVMKQHGMWPSSMMQFPFPGSGMPYFPIESDYQNAQLGFSPNLGFHPNMNIGNKFPPQQYPPQTQTIPCLPSNIATTNGEVLKEDSKKAPVDENSSSIVAQTAETKQKKDKTSGPVKDETPNPSNTSSELGSASRSVDESMKEGSAKGENENPRNGSSETKSDHSLRVDEKPLDSDYQEVVQVAKKSEIVDSCLQKKFDDIPVGGGAAAAGRTFDQILSENLRKQSSNNAKDRNSERTTNLQKPKRTFLKRGEGLKRFTPKNQRKQESADKENREELFSSYSPRSQEPYEPYQTSKTNGDACSRAEPKPKATQKPKCFQEKLDLQSFRNTIEAEKSPSKTERSETPGRKIEYNFGMSEEHSFGVNTIQSTTTQPSLTLTVNEDVTHPENDNGSAMEDLELFELLEQAADTSGCSNVSMLLQYIASNPSVKDTFKHAIPTYQKSPQKHEYRDPNLENEKRKQENFDSSNKAQEPQVKAVYDLESVGLEKEKPKEKFDAENYVSVFGDESCFDDTLANDSKCEDHFNDVASFHDDDDDEFDAATKRTGNGRVCDMMDFTGSVSTSESVLVSNIVPIRSSTPPLRKIASKRIEASAGVAGTMIESNFEDDLDNRESVGNDGKGGVKDLFPCLNFTAAQPSSHVKAVDDGGRDKDRAEDKEGHRLDEKVRRKLAELEEEIRRYRSENAAIEQMRKEKEKKLHLFNTEVANFQTQRDEELRRIETFKQQELASLKRDRKVFEEAQRAAKESLTKREREEVESVRRQLDRVEKEFKAKEQKWRKTVERLSGTVEQQRREIADLKAANQQLERLRIEQMKKQTCASVEAANRKDNKQLATLEQISKKLSSSPTTNAVTSLKIVSSASGLKSKKAASTKQKSGKNGLTLPAPTINGHPPTKKSGVATDPGQSVPAPPAVQPVPLPEENHLQTEKKQNVSSQSGLRSEEQQVFSVPSGRECVSVAETTAEDTGEFDVIENKLADGRVEFVFNNGTRKEISADEKSVTIFFFNGDYKKTSEDGSVVYYYAATKTTQTKFPDGLEVLQFECGQMEKHFKDGTKEIFFPDKSVKLCHPSGEEETTLSDGTVLKMHKDLKTILYPNGQKEIHTPQYKKREYPDGTCKLQYPDGRQETRYASGRVRVKNANGEVILDQYMGQQTNGGGHTVGSSHSDYNTYSLSEDVSARN